MMDEKVETNLGFTSDVRKFLSEYFQIRIWKIFMDARDWIVIKGRRAIQRGVLAADITISLPSDSFDALVMKLEKKDDEIMKEKTTEKMEFDPLLLLEIMERRPKDTLTYERAGVVLLKMLKITEKMLDKAMEMMENE